MTLVDKRKLIADALSKWLWFHRGDRLYTTLIKGKIWLGVSKFNIKEERYVCRKLCILKETKKEVIVPTLKELDKILEGKTLRRKKVKKKCISTQNTH